MDIKEFAQKFIKAEDEAWLKGNVYAFDEVEHADVVYHLTPPMPDVVGREAHKQFLMTARQAFSEFQLEWKYLAGDGNVFALASKSRGIFTGEIPGFPPPTGKEFTADTLMVLRLKDGKIIEVWEKATFTGLG